MKAWEVQEHYLQNNSEDDPAITVIFTQHILFHGNNMLVKSNLQMMMDQIVKAESSIKTKTSEIQANQKKIKNLEKDLRKHITNMHWPSPLAPATSVAPDLTQFREEVVGFLDELHVSMYVKTTVISSDRWSWSLAWV